MCLCVILDAIFISRVSLIFIHKTFHSFCFRIYPPLVSTFFPFFYYHSVCKIASTVIPSRFYSILQQKIHGKENYLSLVPLKSFCLARICIAFPSSFVEQIKICSRIKSIRMIPMGNEFTRRLTHRWKNFCKRCRAETWESWEFVGKSKEDVSKRE